MLTNKSYTNQAVESSLVAVDSGVITTIFTLFTNENFQRVLEGPGHLILFPLAALLSVFRSALAIRQARLDSYKSGTLARAVVEVVSAIAVLTAVTGGIAAAGLFVLASPIIFTAMLGSKTLFNAGAALYYWGKSAVKEITPDKKSAYRAKVKAHIISAFILALTTVSVGLVMLGGQVIFASLGIAAGVLGTVYSVMNAYKSHSLLNKKPVSSEAAISSAALITAGLNLSSEKTASPKNETFTGKQRRGSFFQPANDSQFPAVADSNATLAPSVSIALSR
jgi:hypothetical protein